MKNKTLKFDTKKCEVCPKRDTCAKYNQTKQKNNGKQ